MSNLTTCDYSKLRCICCEFTDDSVAVGYENWIVDTSLDLKAVIDSKKEIEISWPTNFDVRPPPKMKRKHLENVQWDLWKARIHGVGSWLEMRGILNNLEKIGCGTIEKSDRKLIKRKATDGEESDKEANSQKKPCKQNTGARNKSSKPDAGKKKMQLLLNEVLEKKRKRTDSGTPTSEDDDTDDDQMKMESLKKEIQSLRKETEELKTQNRSLKREVRELRSVTISRKYLSNIEERMKILTSLPMPNPNSESPSVVTPTLPSLPSPTLPSPTLPSPTLPSVLHGDGNHDKTNTLEENVITSEIPSQQLDDDTLFARCPKTELRTFINHALEVCFSEEEMTNGKLTDGVANCYRQCPDAAPKKEQLDPERISKIKEYAKKHFDDMKKFNQFVRDKCGNERKKMKKTGA